jgi:GT2 family glycosyltransferase
MEKISASIVVYKTSPCLLTKAIDSYLHSTITGPLYIVDNSPTDELRKFCEGRKTHYIFAGKNLGYGKAHNIAISKTLYTSSYHLVLNPDVSFDPDTLEKIHDFMEDQPQAGLVMPRVVGPDHQIQRLCKLLPTPFNLASRRFLPSGWFKKYNERYELQHSGYNHVMDVPFLSGCFMFLRTSALQKMGLFDERFFLYAEDTDLSRRIHGDFETLFYPGAEISHVHARGSYKDFWHTLYNLRSAIQYFNKWGWFFDKERKSINQEALAGMKETKFNLMALNEVHAA